MCEINNEWTGFCPECQRKNWIEYLKEADIDNIFRITLPFLKFNNKEIIKGKNGFIIS